MQKYQNLGKEYQGICSQEQTLLAELLAKPLLTCLKLVGLMETKHGILGSSSIFFGFIAVSFFSHTEYENISNFKVSTSNLSYLS